ncbi:MAG: 6-phosphogluconolactonase [Methylibium sp.]|uniref:6-phosphogluconolactonase n=1 Tax=Methylibium sp. TaxID=2067992 RepID=UPI0017DB41D8|nr:6-phosphogluconolactonase [Methylibium sp.]MBA3599530.1 6-phosphogluconolactonase [Methylibium sp.]
MEDRNDAPLPGTIALRVLDSPEAFAQAVTAAVSEAVTTAVRERGTASLVVTGGSSPRLYYPLIAALDLPWSRVHITLSDERQVPADHPESNERLVRELLLQDRAAAAHFTPLYCGEDNAQASVAGATQRLEKLPRPFDLVLLGLGNDSHLASLFPGALGVEAAFDPHSNALACTMTPPPGMRPALPRVSLTLAALLDSRRIVIAAQGVEKRDAFERAARGDWPLPSPLRALAEHASQPVDFFWCR